MQAEVHALEGDGVTETLFKWRDEICKLDQENEEYVLPKSLIAYLSQNPKTDVV